MTAKHRILLGIVLGGVAVAVAMVAVYGLLPPGETVSSRPNGPSPGGFAGSVSCRECHEKFYELWSTSHHGLAMRPYDDAFAANELTPQTEEIIVENVAYRAVVSPGAGYLLENGPEGEKQYPIVQVMGGKNVLYLLAPLERGRLQVLPVAYDVRAKQWYDTTDSMVRHAHPLGDAPIDWRDSLLTFNTSCHDCHVSQMTANYDLATDTYRTTWSEPGINCETCHGPAAEHVRVCLAAAKDSPPKDLKILGYGQFSAEQINTTCAPCHAKTAPLTRTYKPGERFFDHYDLTTLEDPDFYPDGRDLGENYSYTQWRLSPCAQSGELTCIHCHTSSGRYRFAGERTNQACMPCHAGHVENPTIHPRHTADCPETRCVSCHMPMTQFARMRRSDHSMFPPAPLATVEFGSPNACNLCHEDQDAGWADAQIRRWADGELDYQQPVLHRGRLIAAAREGDWSQLPAMLEYIVARDGEEVFVSGLIRLLRFCPDERKWPVLIETLVGHESPLVRSAAAAALGDRPTPDAAAALLAATDDDYRLVRVRAARALAPVPTAGFSADDQLRLDEARGELEASFAVREDDWVSHARRGNYLADRRRPREALDAFAVASRLRPDAVPPLLDAALVHAQLNEPAEAEALLRRALTIDPANASAHFNLGLLLADQGDTDEAERQLRAAFEAEPSMAEAADNLGVVLADARPAEALAWCRKAAELRPDVPDYARTLAFYQGQFGDVSGATETLDALVRRHPGYGEGWLMLGEIHRQARRWDAARAVYQRALSGDQLSPDDRRRILGGLEALPEGP